MSVGSEPIVTNTSLPAVISAIRAEFEVIFHEINNSGYYDYNHHYNKYSPCYCFMIDEPSTLSI